MTRDLVLAAFIAGGCSASSSRVFVSNEDDGTVSVIDASTDTVVATIPVGQRPRGLRIAPDGSRLYVALSGSPKAGPGVDERTLPAPNRAADGIGVVDLKTLELVDVLESGPDPESFDLFDGGRKLVVSNEDAAEVSILDVERGAVIARVAVGREPEGVTTAPDGESVWITSEQDARIDVVDPRAARVVGTIPTGARPRSIAFTTDGRRALVSDEADGTVSVVDATFRARTRTIALPAAADRPSGPRPMGIAFARSGGLAFVTTGRGGALAIVDATTGHVERTIEEIGARPWGVAVAQDGRVFTANGPSNDVSVIDPEAGRVITKIAVGGSPWGVVAFP